MDVYKTLDSLRKQGSLRSWLISVTRHKCYHWRQTHQREAIRRSGIANLESDDRLALEPVSLDEMERDQLVREAIFTLPERCWHDHYYRPLHERMAAFLGDQG